MRRIAIGGFRNLRDLGGYPYPAGYTASLRYLRSDCPENLSQEELGQFQSWGITTIIDLRSEAEIARKPCAFAGVEGFQYHSIPLAGGGLPDTEDDVAVFYYDMVEPPEKMKQVMKTIASAPDGVLFHCTAGKDRTGVTAALLLSLAGVGQQDILADYQVSYTYIKPLIDSMRVSSPDLPAFIGRSNPEYMEAFLTRFFQNYGSVEGYLTAIGLSQEEIAALRKKLLPAE